MVLMGSVPCRYRWRAVLPQQPVLARWRKERRSIFLWSRDFLTASFFTRGRWTQRVASWIRAPWREGAVLGQRWWRCFTSCVARGWRRARQRVGQRRGAPCDADKLGDAVKPVLVEVVDWAVARELVHHEERDPSIGGDATGVRRRTSGSQRWSGGAAVLSH